MSSGVSGPLSETPVSGKEVSKEGWGYRLVADLLFSTCSSVRKALVLITRTRREGLSESFTRAFPGTSNDFEGRSGAPHSFICLWDSWVYMDGVPLHASTLPHGPFSATVRKTTTSPSFLMWTGFAKTSYCCPAQSSSLALCLSTPPETGSMEAEGCPASHYTLLCAHRAS